MSHPLKQVLEEIEHRFLNNKETTTVPTQETTTLRRRDYMPDKLAASLERYVERGIPTGGFLRACLENDLLLATSTADDKNILILRDISKYICNELPAPCWGSREKVKAWLREKRLEAGFEE